MEMKLGELFKQELDRLRQEEEKRIEDAVDETVKYLKDNVKILLKGDFGLIVVRKANSDSTTSLITKHERKFVICNVKVSVYDRHNHGDVVFGSEDEIIRRFNPSKEFMAIYRRLESECLPVGVVLFDTNILYLGVVIRTSL